MNRIKAVALDIDGVLTDGFFLLGLDGEQHKKFSFRDVMGISLGMKAGLVFALISGEDNALVDHFAEKLRIVDVYKGCKDKAAALKDFAGKYALELSQVCFMGDDVNDLPALELVGMAAAPVNAHESVQRRAKWIAKVKGGKGAVRELVDAILLSKSQGESE